MFEVIKTVVLLTLWFFMILIFSFPQMVGAWLAFVDQGRWQATVDQSSISDACWVEFEHDYTVEP